MEAWVTRKERNVAILDQYEVAQVTRDDHWVEILEQDEQLWLQCVREAA